MKWYQDNKGNVSSMRILSMAGGIVGMLIALAGTVAMFIGATTAGTAMTIGAGIFASALGAKAWQKSVEK